jgi:signal peptidase I
LHRKKELRLPSEDTEPVVVQTPDGAVTETEPLKKKKSAWRELPVLVVAAVGLSLLIRIFLVQAFYIPSESMEQTLQGCAGCSNNDRVLVWKLGKHFGPPNRGDIVVFDGRGSFVTQNNEKDYIKRVIGLPGDKVMCCDSNGRVVVNGKALDEKYLFEDDHMRFGPIVVPKGELWLMGDHRSASSDSRYNGTVPINRVVGKAFVIVWPPSRAGLLH